MIRSWRYACIPVGLKDTGGVGHLKEMYRYVLTCGIWHCAKASQDTNCR